MTLWSCGTMRWQSPLLRDHPLTGSIIEQKTERAISREELITLLDQYPVILIGEKHDNPDHHVIESMLLKALVGPDTTVVFEMLDDRYSAILETLSADLTLKQLKERLRWPEKGWPWKDYGPLFLQVLQQGGTLKTGNISQETMMTIYAHGFNSLKQQDYYASINRVAQDLQTPLLEMVYESHCRKIPMEKLQPMVDIQLARDARMAFALETVDRPKRILIAGGVHTAKDIGIPRHLSNPTQSATVILTEVNRQWESIQDYPVFMEAKADYIWFTPKLTEEDYCNRFE